MTVEGVGVVNGVAVAIKVVVVRINDPLEGVAEKMVCVLEVDCLDQFG